MQFSKQGGSAEKTKIQAPKESGTSAIPTRIKTASPLILSETAATPNQAVLRRLAELSQHVASVHRATAEAYLSQGMYAESMIHLEAASRFDPGNTEFHNQLGIVRFLTGDDQGALAAFSMALEGNSEGADAHFNRGMVLYGLARREEAERAFGRAALLNDRDAETWNNLGVVRFELGRHAEARTCFEKALQVQPNHLDAVSNLKLVG